MIEQDQEDLLIHFHDWIIFHQDEYYLNISMEEIFTQFPMILPLVDACAKSATCLNRSDRKISIAPNTPRAFSLCG